MFGIEVEVLNERLKPDTQKIRNNREHFYDQVIRNFQIRFGMHEYDELLRKTNIPRSKAENFKSKETLVKALCMQEPNGGELWNYIQATIRDQYDAEVLLKQIQQSFKKKLDLHGTIGLSGITADDIYFDDYNYLFGSGEPRLGVISHARFYDNETSLDTAIKRTVMQAFSTTGFIIGIPRCTSPTCARAYAHSLAEHDRKEDQICRECRDNLRERYRELSITNKEDD